MQCFRKRNVGAVETDRKHYVKVVLTNATLTGLLYVVLACAAQQANADPASPEQLKRSRSTFEYHDGSSEEKRAYRRPDLDIDPTNLKMEELRERINMLEERLERLEYESSTSKRVR